MAAPMAVCMLLCSVVFFGITVMLHFKMNEIQKEPYMDEIFHVPQSQKYCRGEFKQWDPMITTLPGLYVVTAGLFKPISWALDMNVTEICTPFWLRGLNVVFTFGNFYLIYRLTTKLHQTSGLSTILESMTLASFPLLYFYTFLYYTDPGAIFFVLLMYTLHLHDNHVMAAILGAMSIVFRQTNVVWVVFIAGLSIGKALVEQLQLEKKEVNTETLSDWMVLKLTWQLIGYPSLTSPRKLVSVVLDILQVVWSYIVVGLGFVAFVYLNDGIVVGDKSHHEACLHFPQLLYFFGFALFFAFPHLISFHKAFDFIQSTVKNPLPMMCFSTAAWFSVWKFTYVHEFLLADNRHYPFYIWSKIFRRHDIVRYAFIPVYYYALWAICQLLKNRDIFWKATFSVCIIVATVPQKLLEFRYFIIPYLIFRLNMPSQPVYKIMLELMLYTSVNGLTLYMYMYKPFKWENEDSWQRFIW